MRNLVGLICFMMKIQVVSDRDMHQKTKLPLVFTMTKINSVQPLMDSISFVIPEKRKKMLKVGRAINMPYVIWPSITERIKIRNSISRWITSLTSSGQSTRTSFGMVVPIAGTQCQAEALHSAWNWDSKTLLAVGSLQLAVQVGSQQFAVGGTSRQSAVCSWRYKLAVGSLQ